MTEEEKVAEDFLVIGEEPRFKGDTTSEIFEDINFSGFSKSENFLNSFLMGKTNFAEFLGKLGVGLYYQNLNRAQLAKGENKEVDFSQENISRNRLILLLEFLLSLGALFFFVFNFSKEPKAKS
jgi:hypothetical protein